MNASDILHIHKDDLDKLKEAQFILAQIWEHCGPYGQEKVPSAVVLQMQQYYMFDDSE